ncbi:dethiobiotin synthase [Acetobacteraceae bacterium ESL0709]|nr:dethiobiotin synthase [Acetobacteraceae bacterium ESL0697]MDF7677212.1 dethiobiotin synthase [Acetobacteraceae bacterium ESL0709]
MHKIKGVFVTGTDTGIGKTLVSAVLAEAWHGCYWKPFQTGLSTEAGDTETVRHLAHLHTSRIIPPYCELQAPLSPYMAARKEGMSLDPQAITLPETRYPLIVEGAGGLMVPITSDCLMIDLIARLGLPVILVARAGLGTINHTLLSLKALSHRHIPVCGFIFNGGDNAENRHFIENHSNIKCLFHIPFYEQISPLTISTIAQIVPPLEQMAMEDSLIFR